MTNIKELLNDSYKGLHPKSKEYINSTDITERKELGQYFTPRKAQLELLNELPKDFLDENLKILDPACGTGEFLYTLNKLSDDNELHGWELDDELVDVSNNVIPDANIEKTNSLKKKSSEQFDLIIGNPPYYEFQPDEYIKREYDDIINGRLNIYALFLYKSIELLRDGGYLAFVNPPSMNNGAYFSDLREYIINNCNIEYISVLDDTSLFKDAQQSVMLFILKKGENKGDYVFERNGKQIFSEGADYLKSEFKDKKTLCELGYKVHTGKIVWNSNKKHLKEHPDGSIPLIWSRNIKGGEIKLENHDKPQYIDIDKENEGPAIVVNRVVGKPGNGSVRAAKIEEGDKFLAENHVNVIKPKSNPVIDIDHILDELNSKNNIKVLQKITGNSQLSKTELERLFPISTN